MTSSAHPDGHRQALESKEQPLPRWSAALALLEEDLRRDLERSHRVMYKEWSRRPFHERVVEAASWILERQS